MRLGGGSCPWNWTWYRPNRENSQICKRQLVNKSHRQGSVIFPKLWISAVIAPQWFFGRGTIWQFYNFSTRLSKILSWNKMRSSPKLGLIAKLWTCLDFFAHKHQTTLERHVLEENFWWMQSLNHTLLGKLWWVQSQRYGNARAKVSFCSHWFWKSIPYAHHSMQF